MYSFTRENSILSKKNIFCAILSNKVIANNDQNAYQSVKTVEIFNK